MPHIRIFAKTKKISSHLHPEKFLVTSRANCLPLRAMLRYRGYNWALVHGESCIEVHLTPTSGAKRKPLWSLTLHYVAVGPEWRRCGKCDRPHFTLEVTDFHVPPGDWQNLSDVDFWNDAEFGKRFGADDYRSPGYLNFYFQSSSRDESEKHSAVLCPFHWRVVQRDGALITIELAADTDPQGTFPQVLETVSAIPGQAAETDYSTIDHEIYLIETLPFGIVTVPVPRNAPDAYTYAEEHARRQFKTPHASHMTLNDYQDCTYEDMRNDLYVELHYFGYHST